MKKVFLLIIFVGVLGFGLYSFKDNLGGLLAQITSNTGIPVPPYALKVTVTNYNQINLSWVDDSINMASGITVTEYRVYRRESYGTWNFAGKVTSTAYTDYNMPSGNYEYKINACNTNGCSADSATIAASFSKDTTAPSVPASLTVPQKEVTDTKANLYWLGSSDDVLLKYYNIYRSPSTAGNFSLIASVSASQLSYTDDKLSPASQYYYQVKAVDGAKNESGPSNTIDITTTTLAGTNSYIRIVSPNDGECFTLPGNLHIAWTGSNLNQTALYYSNKMIFLGGSTVFDWYMTASVSPTTVGYIKAVAVDNNGKEGISDMNDKPFVISLDCSKEIKPSTALTLVPAVPSYARTSLVYQKSDINLIWQDNSNNENSFRVYRRQFPDGKWQMLSTVSQNITAYTDINVPQGDYEYDVSACNIYGCSTYSNQSRITAVASLPFKTYSAPELNSGDMISAGNSDDPDVYIINEHGYKRLFLNPIIFNFYAHLGGFQNIRAVEGKTRDAYATSGLFKNCESGDPKIYGIEITGEDIGTLHWVNTSGEQAVADDPNFFNKVFCINNNEFNWYQKGTEYSSVGQIPSYSR